MRLENVSRREFLQMSGAAAAGLAIAVHLPSSAVAADFAPNVWVHIGEQGKVTLVVAKSEMGQGVFTALPAILAEELEVDLKDVSVQQALADRAKYGDQTTGGSTSVREGWLPLRKAGAAAREMLIAAAAQRWKVDASQCVAESGSVQHAASGRKAGYGELAVAAAALPVPPDPKLKDPKNFRLLGKRFARLDTPSKTDGSAVFGMDVRLPGMLYACVARCPVVGGKVKSVNADKARAMGGVHTVVPMDTGVAIVADSTWMAMKACEALEVVWDEGAGAQLDTKAILETYRAKLMGPATLARAAGDAAAAIKGAAKKIEADYELPYVAHAAMEPLNCTAYVRGQSCEIWTSTQVANDVQEGVAKLLGLPVNAVTVHVTFLGGGFGRRLQNDDALEAALVSKAINGPVKVVWTRQDDIQHDYYRPNSINRFAAALDAAGKPVAFTNRMAIPSISEYLWPGSVKNGEDDGLKDELDSMDYDIPNVLLDYVLTNTVAPQVPLGWWRSVYSSQNGFAQECFVDEMAVAAGRDPYEFRAQLLAKSPRMLGVLKAAAEKAGWGQPLPPGRGRGIAVYRCFGSYAAMVAEASVDKAGWPVVHRMVCAVDCGQIVNPAIIESQMQSAVVFGLTAALNSEITINKGRVQQSNFDDYLLLSIDQMPTVEVTIVPSHEAPGGIGEPGVPPVAPAVANALFAATGKRIRKLPIPRPA